MRRKLGMVSVIVAALCSAPLAAQSSCRGDHCSLSLSANAAALIVSVPAVARVAVVRSAAGAAVRAWGNTRLVLQAQQDPASYQPTTLATASVPRAEGRSLGIPDEGWGSIRFTATAP